MTIFDQLQHSYGEVSDLHTIVYKPKSDAEMMAKPDTVECGCTVAPEVHDEQTQLLKGFWKKF